MKHIGSYEAKTSLPRILKQVEAGETFVVTRNGRPVARIGPVAQAGSTGTPKEVMRKLRALKLNLGGIENVRVLRDEGRRS